MRRAGYWLATGAIGGLLTVSLGAFGAHGLKGRIGPDLLANWGTAADYLGMHALAILVCGLILLWLESRPLQGGGLINAAAWCFLTGSLLFSGSLFAMALTGARMLGMITPIGGAALFGAMLLFFR